MFRNSKILIVLLLLCFILCGCKQTKPVDTLTTIMQRDKIIVGVRDDAAPFGYKDEKGNLAGYDIDLAKIIAKSLLGSDEKIEFVPVTATNRIMKLDSGEFDMLIAMMSMTKKREMIVDFSIPYYVAGQAILVKNSCTKTSLRDFKGKKLIIIFGSTSENNLRTNVPEIDIIGFRTYNDAFQALKDGKAEGIVADDTILMNYALKDKSVKLLPKRYSKEPYSIAFRKEPQSKNLIIKVDYIINYLAEIGVLNKLQEKWGINQ